MYIQIGWEELNIQKSGLFTHHVDLRRRRRSCHHSQIFEQGKYEWPPNGRSKRRQRPLRRIPQFYFAQEDEQVPTGLLLKYNKGMD